MAARLPCAGDCASWLEPSSAHSQPIRGSQREPDQSSATACGTGG